jgi:hypothetical protein
MEMAKLKRLGYKGRFTMDIANSKQGKCVLHENVRALKTYKKLNEE